MHPKRHPIHLDYQVGCDAEGKLTAIRALITGDTGAYASVGMKVLERAVGHATSAYTVPVAHIIGHTVYTNNIPCGAMRGFGANQATYAMEVWCGRTVRNGRLRPLAVPLGQCHHRGRMHRHGPRSSRAARACGPPSRPSNRPTRRPALPGLGCGIKNTGIGNGMPDGGKCMIEVAGPERIVIHHGWTEMGQGAHHHGRAGLLRGDGSPAATGRRHGRYPRRNLVRHDHGLARHLLTGQRPDRCLQGLQPRPRGPGPAGHGGPHLSRRMGLRLDQQTRRPATSDR